MGESDDTLKHKGRVGVLGGGSRPLTVASGATISKGGPDGSGSSAGAEAGAANSSRGIRDRASDSIFLELFAGQGGLTAAVRRLGMEAYDAKDLNPEFANNEVKLFDMLNPSDYKTVVTLLRRRKVR